MVSLRFKIELYMLVMVLLPLVFLLFCDAAVHVDMAEVAPIARARRTLGSEPGELESEVIVVAPSPGPLLARARRTLGSEPGELESEVVVVAPSPGPLLARARRTLGSEPGELESEVVIVSPSPGPLSPAYATSTRDVQSPQSSPVPVEPRMCSYTIIMNTGYKAGAGTDSNISLRLRNPANESIFFDSLGDTAHDNFETGSSDFFILRSGCVLQICQMTLYTDYSGWFASWYPESIEVYVNRVAESSEADHQKWYILQWLPTDDEAEAHFLVRDNCRN